VGPATILAAGLFFVPLGLMVWMSLNNWPILGAHHFAGATNYRAASPPRLSERASTSAQGARVRLLTVFDQLSPDGKNLMAQDTPKEMRKQDPVMSMLTGRLFSYVGYALAKLKVAELLSGKTVYIQHLAEQTGTDRGALLQLMRTGAYLGLFIEAPPRYFALAEGGRPPLEDAERSQRGSLIRNVERNGPLLDQIMHTLYTRPVCLSGPRKALLRTARGYLPAEYRRPDSSDQHAG
jgi:hypothetical protein